MPLSYGIISYCEVFSVLFAKEKRKKYFFCTRFVSCELMC